MKPIKSDIPIQKLLIRSEELFTHYRGGVRCPYCGQVHKQYRCADGRYRCSICNRRYSLKVGTIFQSSKLSYETIVLGMWFVLAQNVLSSITLAKLLSISISSAWLFIKKLQYSTNQTVKLSDEVSVDEMYLGGSWSNKHTLDKISLLRKYDIIDEDKYQFTPSEALKCISLYKSPVFGGNDGNNIFLIQTPTGLTSRTIKKIFKEHTDNVSVTVSDDSELYNDWITPIDINTHSKRRYRTANGRTSNSIEGTFSHYKNRFRGSHIHCHRKYIQLYLNLFVFKWNTRNDTMDASLTQLFARINTICTYKHIRAYDSLSVYDTVDKMKKAREQAELLLNSLGAIAESVTIKGRTYRSH